MQRRLVPFVVGLVLLVTVAIATAALARVSGATPISVPTLIGMAQQEAINAAQTRGLTATVGDSRASPDPPGSVIAQSPAQGTLTTGPAHRTDGVERPGADPGAEHRRQRLEGREGDARRVRTGSTSVTREFNETVDKDVVLRVSPAPGLQVSPDTKLAVVRQRRPRARAGARRERQDLRRGQGRPGGQSTSPCRPRSRTSTTPSRRVTSSGPTRRPASPRRTARRSPCT